MMMAEAGRKSAASDLLVRCVIRRNREQIPLAVIRLASIRSRRLIFLRLLMHSYADKAGGIFRRYLGQLSADHSKADKMTAKWILRIFPFMTV